jgi:hypothetical protein
MKVLKIFILFLSLLTAYNSVAQEKSILNYNFEYDEDLYEVTKGEFHKPLFSSTIGWIVIKSDFDPDVSLSGDNSSVAWENGEKITPIAYVSGRRAKVSAEFDITCSSGQGEY